MVKIVKNCDGFSGLNSIEININTSEDASDGDGCEELRWIFRIIV